MAKQIIAATISVETGAANASVKEFNQNVNQAESSLKNIGGTSSGVGKSIEGTGGAFGKLKSSIGTLPGPLGAAQGAVGGLSKAFTALLANPVGLILAAIVGILVLLYKSFTNTFEGAQKVEQVFAGIGAAGQALLDNLGKIASAIKNVFTFNFSGAKKDIEEVANAAKNAYNTMAKLTAEAQKLKREQAQNDFDSIERAAKLAQLREDATDETIPIKKRIELGKQLLAESEQNAKDDLELARRTAENKIKQLTLEKDGENKNFEEILKIRGEQKQGEIENANELRRIRKTITQAEKQEESERAAIAKEAAERQKEANAKYKEHLKEQKRLADEQAKLLAEINKSFREQRLDDAKQLEKDFEASQKEQARIDKAEADRILNNEKTRLENKKKLAELAALDNPDDPAKKVALIQASLDLENNVLAANDLQRQINAKKASNEIVKIKEDEVAAKKALADIERKAEEEKVAAISGGLGNLAEIAGKQTVAGKAFAIAQTTIDTYQSAIAAYKSLAGIPVVGPVLGAIAAAAAIKTGIDTVKKITAVNIPGKGSGGSGGGPSLTIPAAPLAPTQSSTLINQGQISQIGNATVRAYLVDTDAITNAERNSRLSRAARLGG